MLEILAQGQFPPVAPSGGAGAFWYWATLIALAIITWIRQEKLIKPISKELKTNGGLPPEAMNRPHGTTKEEAIIGVIETKKQNEKLDEVLVRLSDVGAVKKELAEFKQDVTREIADARERMGHISETVGSLTVAVGEMKVTADANAERLAKVENWIAREIRHEAAGDLNASNLLKELEQREREIAEQQAKDADDDGPTDNVGQI